MLRPCNREWLAHLILLAANRRRGESNRNLPRLGIPRESQAFGRLVLPYDFEQIVWWPQLRPGGTVLLTAPDHAAAARASRPRVLRHAPVIRYFSVTPGNAVIERHKRSGGICYEVVDGQLTETAGGLQRIIMNLAELPGAFDGRAWHVVANALAAVAACRACGVTVKNIREALSTFTPGAVNPGRGNVYAVSAGPAASAAAGPVLVDYGHNAAALHATGQMVATVWAGEPVAAITLPGDRRDDLVAESAEAIATWFGTVIVYEDEDLRGRAPGEMRELIAGAMRKVRPGIHVTFADGPAGALRSAVALAAGGAVLFLYEKLEPALAALGALGATPWPEEDLMGRLDGGPLLDDLATELEIQAVDGDTAPIPAIGPGTRQAEAAGAVAPEEKS
jgi:cyanophycin synthetase